MSVKFFGQFLIERGEVDGGHVREALDLMERTNRNLGQIAIDEGMLSESHADEINQRQRRADRSFGDLAVDLGLITSAQLVALLRIQREAHLLLGEALVHLGHLPAERLSGMLDEFKIDQAPYRTRSTELPDALASNHIAGSMVRLLPSLAMRVSRIVCKIGDARPFDGTPAFARHRIAVPITGARGLEVTLVGDRAFCTKLAAGACGLPPEELDEELVVDGVGEFLNILAGNVVAALERDGLQVELGPPDYEADLHGGHVFELAVDTGEAALVLAPL